MGASIMGRKNVSIEGAILESFQGSQKSSSGLSKLSDEEYVGYVTANVRLAYLNLDGSVIDILAEVRRLFEEGRL